MSRDLRLPLRQAVIKYLRTQTALTALVPAGQIYGERTPSNPPKPYIAYGPTDVEAFEATGINGGTIPINLHVFADGESSDTIAPISATLLAVLDEAQLDLDEGNCFDISFVRATSVSHGSKTQWHDRVSFSALTGIGD